MWNVCCSLSFKEQWIIQILLHRRLVLLFFRSWWSFGVRLSFHNSFAAATNHEAIIEHGMLLFFSGGKDGPVGFADFVYKHIVPACFLAPLKQTFDLADAQTVLVCIMDIFFFLLSFLWGKFKLRNLQWPCGIKDRHLTNKIPCVFY